VFSEVGFFQARIDQIILRANVARGTFYVYFKDKEAIFQEVASQTIEELYVEASSGVAGDLLTRIQRGNEGYLRAFERHWKVMKALLEVAVSNPRFAAIYQGMRQRFVVRLQKHIADNVEAKEYRNLDLSVAADGLGCMVEWYAFTYFVFQERSNEQPDLTHVSRVLTEIWLSGTKYSPSLPLHGSLDETGAQTSRSSSKKMSRRFAPKKPRKAKKSNASLGSNS